MMTCDDQVIIEKHSPVLIIHTQHFSSFGWIWDVDAALVPHDLVISWLGFGI